MAGNVSEWVMDIYRPLSYQDFDDLNPMRRDGFLDDGTKYDNQWRLKNPKMDPAKAKKPVKGVEGDWVENNPTGFISPLAIRPVCTKVVAGKMLLTGCPLVHADSWIRIHLPQPSVSVAR